MADYPHIPEQDPDLKLAREIGKRLDSDRPLSGMEDPLIASLLEYRERVDAQKAELRVDSTSLWNRIERQTKPEEQTGSSVIHPIRIKQNHRIWAAAATILIIVTAGIYFLMNTGGPTLIAETGHQAETVVLEDGSRIILRPFSKISRISESSRQSRYKLTGEGYFEVATQPNRVFSVTAGNGSVSVLGTKFVLSNWGEMVQLYLQEGSVRIETIDRTSSEILQPGQFATISGTRLSKPATAESDRFTDWLNNELTFRNQTAAYVFAELEQHFNIEISAPRQTRETKIGGTLSLSELETSLSYLETLLSGSFEPVGDRRFRFVPRE